MADNVLHVEHITMQFGGVVAVNNLTLDVNQGEIVALIGPNGAGKTTAFNCITGVYEPTNGKVDFLGRPMVESFPQGKMDKQYAGENKGLYGKKLSPTPDKITQLGIARTLVDSTFILVIAAVAVAFAISFGIGGRDFAKAVLSDVQRKFHIGE